MDEQATTQWLKANKHLLLKQFDEADFCRATWLQVQKDFSNFGQTVPQPEDQSAQQLQVCIGQSLQALLRSQPSLIPALLYQIDLPEAAMHILPGYEDEYIRQLAEWILVREAYKVYLRKTFSS